MLNATQQPLRSKWIRPIDKDGHSNGHKCVNIATSRGSDEPKLPRL